MAGRKKKINGTDLQSTDSDPLLAELEAIFTEYPIGVQIAYGFLTTEASSPFVQILGGSSVWRVRRNCVDRCIDGVSDRVDLVWTKKNAPTEQ